MSGIAYNVLKNPKELRPHPMNVEIYGTEVADPDLVESIRRRGILDPLVIREDNTVLSGHRRRAAAIAIGVDRVPVRVVSFDDPLDEEEALIEWNRQREKTFSQKMREAEVLERIEKKRSEGRMKAGVKPEPSGNVSLGSVGQTRDIVADKIGMSGKTFDKAKEVWQAAKEGDELAQSLVGKIDAGKSTVTTALKEIQRTQQLEDRRAELVARAEEVAALPDTIQVHHANFLTDYHILGAASVDCIITDPPYVKEWLGNFEAFAAAAEHVLKPGGFLITYLGHIHLDQIMAQMTPYLDYYWLAVLKHAGTTAAVHSRSVTCGYKPILILQKPPRTKPKRYFCDVILGTGREKDAHEWQQGEEELRQLFEPFTDPGDTVLDPFMGSGTTIAMAKKMNRRAIGFDIDGDNVAIVTARVSA